MSHVSESNVEIELHPVVAAPARPALWLLLWVWLALGAQSFGGGTATLYLIRRAVVERRRWISEQEFTRDWAISHLPPGINLLALTTLIGWRLRGPLGVGLSLLGLLLPSVSITVLLTALYAGVRDLPVMQSALRGVIPATVGLGLLMSFQMGRPLLIVSWGEGWRSLLLSGALLVGSALAVLLWQLPVVAVLCGAGAIGALGRWFAARRAGWVRP
jgi:chromate transporter